MKKQTVLIAMTTAFAFLSLITGCQKEQTNNTLTPQEEEQAAYTSSQSETEAQSVFDDVLDNVMGVNNDLGTGGVGIFGRTTATDGIAKVDSMPRCVAVSITPQQPNVFPKTVVRDFGTGCLSHGHLRAGKIITIYTGRLSEPGKSATTTFENFSIDSVKIEGTHKVTNSTAQGSNHRQFRIEIRDGKLTRPNGNYEEWNATRIHTQIEGNGTHTPADDIFRITGNSNGKTKRGTLAISWVSEIQEPLIKRFSCRWLTKGIIKTVRNGLPSGSPWTAILDFGDGACDNKATLTTNGNIRQIVLR